MPFQDWNLKSTFDEAYDLNGERDKRAPGPRVRLHYHRSVIYPTKRTHATKLMAALGWTTPGPKLVILGAGFGWLAEALETDHGFTHVISLDTSTYIQAEKDNTEEAEIETEITKVGLDPATGRGLELKNRHFDGGVRTRTSKGCRNNDLSNGQMKNEVKAALALQGNQKPDVILTEDVIANLTDLEFQDISNALNNWTNQLIHFVTTTDPANFMLLNWHTLEEWKALAPSDTFLEPGSFRVL